MPVLERLVRQLSARLGIFAIVGNHDGDLLGARLSGWGIHYIGRRFVQVEAHNAAVELIGLPGVKRGDFDAGFLKSIPVRRRGVPRIVLAHFPDQVRRIASVQADLMLAGHTHGGQLCLPGGHALMTHDSLPRRMARGIHAWGQTLLVVNRGLGMTRWPIRLFCPAEVVEMRLTCATPTGAVA